MAGFLYYLPKDKTIQVAGLSYALRPSVLEARTLMHSGPDGGAGKILADPDRVPGEMVNYHPDRQDWRKIPGSDAWVGMTREHPPKPMDLARDIRIAGHLVQLSDGEWWECPVARAVVETPAGDLEYAINLPTRSRLNAAGEWESGGVHPKYDQLWRYAEQWWDLRLMALSTLAGEVIPEGQVATVNMTFDSLHVAAVAALQVNYALGPAEVDLAGLLDDKCMPRVMAALVDEPTIAEWRKKKARSTAAA